MVLTKTRKGFEGENGSITAVRNYSNLTPFPLKQCQHPGPCAGITTCIANQHKAQTTRLGILAKMDEPTEMGNGSQFQRTTQTKCLTKSTSKRLKILRKGRKPSRFPSGGNPLYCACATVPIDRSVFPRTAPIISSAALSLTQKR